jgi:large subunit ribosomal protein L23
VDKNNMITSKLIKNPRITEKASFNAEKNVYTFDIADKANKTEIKKAIFEIYKVKAEKINILKRKPKKVVSKGRVSFRKGGKKAFVYLKKEDKIEII